MDADNHTWIYAVVFFLLAMLGIGFCWASASSAAACCRPPLAAIAWAIVLAVALLQVMRTQAGFPRLVATD